MAYKAERSKIGSLDYLLHTVNQMGAAQLDQKPGPALPAQSLTLTARIHSVDLAFFRLLASWSLPKAVTLPLILMVRIADGYIWAFIAMYLWWAMPFAELELALMHCILSIAISLCLYFPIKFGFKRPRPYDNGLDVRPLVPPLDKYSFPSGHTMNNLAVALTLALHMPGLLVPALLLPVAMGMLRILFGVHYLSDIAGGAILGTAAFLISKAVFPSIGV